MRTINLIVVHCSATQGNRMLSPEALDLMHRRRGFNGTGYHYYIRKDGTVHLTRPVERIRRPERHRYPCRTPEQRAALRLLVHQLLEKFPDCRVCGHRDLSPDKNGNGEIEPEEWMKACPCFDAEEEFKELVAEGTVETQSKLNYLKNEKGGK